MRDAERHESATLAAPRFNTVLFGMFAGLALALLFGVGPRDAGALAGAAGVIAVAVLDGVHLLGSPGHVGRSDRGAARGVTARSKRAPEGRVNRRVRPPPQGRAG
jgi:hypothetical protein